MSNKKELMVKISAQVDQFKTSMKDIKKSMSDVVKDTRQFTKDVGQGLVTTGKVMTGAGLAITGAIAGIVKVGADWSAQVAGQEFLYKNLDATVQKTINTDSKKAESIGLTEQQYKNSATTMDTYYKNMGLTSQETSKLSGETMNLVADLAAVTDMPFDEAMTRFKSGLMGNYEALDAFGVNVSAASLENSEFVKGLGKSWKQLSDTEKMMAVYNEVMRQGASAQGLAKQEADQFGMKMKLLKQKIMETVASIGEKLLPVLEPLIDKIVKTTEKIADWVANNPELTRTILMIVGAIGIFLTVVGPIISLIGAIALAMAGLTIASAPVILAVAGITAAIIAVIAIGALLIANWDTIKTKAGELGEKISETWNNIKQWTSDTWNNVKESISQAWEAVKTKTSEIWDNCVQVVSEAWEWIKLAVQAGIQFIGDLIGLAFDIITLPWQFIWQNCGDYVIQAWEWIKTTVGDALNFVGDKIKEGWDKVMSVTQPIWDAIVGFISEKWEQLKSWASEKFNAIKNNISNAWNNVKSASSQAWSIITGALSSKWEEIKSKAKEKFNAIKTTVTNAWNNIKSKTSEIWNGVKDKVSEIWNKIKDIVKKGVDKLKSLVNFKWELPKLKMPHITTSGKFSLNPPSVPHFGIEWKSSGGIFRRPTVLGSGYGVGDKHRGAGSNMEAVLPLNKLPELLGLDKNENKGLMINIEQFTNNTDADIENICNRIAFELKRRRVV